MESEVLKYEFQVIKPIIHEKGKNVIGHASSNNSQYEEEIERLKKRIKELESIQNESEKKSTNDQMIEWIDKPEDDEWTEFFDELSERKIVKEGKNDKRNKNRSRKTR